MKKDEPCSPLNMLRRHDCEPPLPWWKDHERLEDIAHVAVFWILVGSMLLWDCVTIYALVKDLTR